ncbi:hypothetical protein ACFX1T_044638 [Malus domestica]
MGYCPCFGFRKGRKLETGTDEAKDDKTDKADKKKTINNKPQENVTQLSSSEEDGINGNNKAQTFTFRELATATKNFRTDSCIGEGGFGPVYKGKLASGQAVAVKKLDQTGLQGEKEFLVEVLMLSLLRHSNLVSLIGYCAEGEQRLLVYEYMPLGSLADHLHDLPPGQEPIDWNKRMMIAAGAAKGLEYLHHEADPPVIYRDLKSANILLGEDFFPKLSDFGLAKFGPTGDRSHVSTRVMGTHGYCAPEYAKSGKLTAKSDIYSFGVVLLELITGHKAVDSSLGREKHLVEWARPFMKDHKNIAQLADPLLRGRFQVSILRKAFEVAFMCLREDASTRPSMTEVVLAMNYLTSRLYSEPDENKVVDIKNSEPNTPDETTAMLKKESERERAVAEAKMWGETWRDKRRQEAQKFQALADMVWLATMSQGRASTFGLLSKFRGHGNYGVHGKRKQLHSAVKTLRLVEIVNENEPPMVVLCMYSSSLRLPCFSIIQERRPSVECRQKKLVVLRDCACLDAVFPFLSVDVALRASKGFCFYCIM